MALYKPPFFSPPYQLTSLKIRPQLAMFASLAKVLPLDHIHHSQRSAELETLSDDSRPSTSSSFSASSVAYPDDGTIPWPKSWVYLCTADATRDVLRRILAESKGAGPFGVCIGDTVEQSFVEGWSEQTCGNIQYFASTGDSVGLTHFRVSFLVFMLSYHHC